MQLRRGQFSCGMEPGRLALLVVEALLLVLLVPLAHATPPDPLWIPGIYDDADHDDVVGLLTDTGQVGPAVGPGAGLPATSTRRSLNHRSAPLVNVSLCSTLRLRSPPSR
jgi:hypothetical protein